MNRLKTLTWLTWIELLRERMVLVFLFSSTCLLALTLILGSLSLDEKSRILVHFGFSIFRLSLVGLALFLGASAVHRDVERQTCLLILARPLSRSRFLVGKWLGCCSLLATIWAGYVIVHFFLLDFLFSKTSFLALHVGVLLESWVLLTFAFFSGIHLKPVLALGLSTVWWLAAQWQQDLAFFAQRSKSSFYESAQVVAPWLLPAFDRWPSASIHVLKQQDLSIFVFPYLQAVLWIAVLISAACWLFERRDLV